MEWVLEKNDIFSKKTLKALATDVLEIVERHLAKNCSPNSFGNISALPNKVIWRKTRPI